MMADDGGDFSAIGGYGSCGGVLCGWEILRHKLDGWSGFDVAEEAEWRGREGAGVFSRGN